MSDNLVRFIEYKITLLIIYILPNLFIYYYFFFNAMQAVEDFCTLQPSFSIYSDPSHLLFAFFRRCLKYLTSFCPTIAGVVLPLVAFLLGFGSVRFV